MENSPLGRLETIDWARQLASKSACLVRFARNFESNGSRIIGFAPNLLVSAMRNAKRVRIALPKIDQQHFAIGDERHNQSRHATYPCLATALAGQLTVA
jgi:hypothetical protein